ncbi:MULTISPECIES: hypothetical protein [Bacillus]|uniref:hypothetical protein n=1 Tax=Bacillus TaxID=1386 RepID=UPI0004196841|nr:MULTISPECIES: hypothetical protein [Bacillus]QHZ48608.1 hypothetical protein M654_021305 [Bacillus sp. NSP9.1]
MKNVGRFSGPRLRSGKAAVVFLNAISGPFSLIVVIKIQEAAFSRHEDAAVSTRCVKRVCAVKACEAFSRPFVYA